MVAEERRELQESIRSEVDAAIASRGSGLAEDPILRLIASDIADLRFVKSQLVGAASRKFFTRDGQPNAVVGKLLDTIAALAREQWRLIDRAIEVSPSPESKVLVEIVEVPYGE